MTKPTHIGRFKIVRRLGSSEFGVTYLCRDWELETDVAIKVFANDCRVAGYAPEVWRLRFLYEARLLADIDHPNVVRLKGFGRQNDQTPYFVMPYLPISVKDLIGSDQRDPEKIAKLREDRKPRALPLADGLDLIAQALRGLAHLHERGLVHRDVKPHNMLLTARDGGTLKLSDFGLVKQPDQNLTRISGWIGTRNYIAPEQRQCAKKVDARADVYAVALTGYRILAGKLPDAVPPPLKELVPDIPQAVSDLFVQAMTADRDARPKDAGAMLAALEAAITPPRR